jgi:hypothetical protein
MLCFPVAKSPVCDVCFAALIFFLPCTGSVLVNGFSLGVVLLWCCFRPGHASPLCSLARLDSVHGMEVSGSPLLASFLRRLTHARQVLPAEALHFLFSLSLLCYSRSPPDRCSSSVASTRSNPPCFCFLVPVCVRFSNQVLTGQSTSSLVRSS